MPRMAAVRMRGLVAIPPQVFVVEQQYCRFFTRNAGVGRLSTITDSRGARHPNQSANSANSFTLASWDLGLHRACTTLDLGPSCGRPDQSLLRLDSFARGNVLVRIAVIERFLRQCATATSS